MTKVPPTTSLDEIGAEPFLGALVRSSEDAMIGKTPDGRWSSGTQLPSGSTATKPPKC